MIDGWGPLRGTIMAIYRVFSSADGHSHIEEISPESRPEIASLTNVAEASIRVFPEVRTMDFHPLPERRLIIHLSGEVEIETSDGAKQIFRAGDVRLMEDTGGRGHAHRDLGAPNAAAYIILQD